MSTRRKGPPRNGTVLPPMNPDSRGKIAMAMYSAIAALEHAPSSITVDEVAHQLAIMTGAIDTQSSTRIKDRTDAPSRAIVTALTAVEAIIRRNDKGKGWSVHRAQREALRAAAATFDEALRRIPFVVYEAARAYVDEQLGPSSAGVTIPSAPDLAEAAP